MRLEQRFSPNLISIDRLKRCARINQPGGGEAAYPLWKKANSHSCRPVKRLKAQTEADPPSTSTLRLLFPQSLSPWRET